jgi:hypothetical protein
MIEYEFVNDSLMAMPSKDEQIIELKIRVEQLREEALAWRARYEDGGPWVSTKDLLPDISGPCSSEVEVAYRHPHGKYYYRMYTQYWKDGGWVFGMEDGLKVPFEDCGYVIDYWRKLTKLPPIKETEDDA